MSELIEELDGAITFVEKVNSVAVKGLISGEEKEALIQTTKDEVATIMSRYAEKRKKEASQAKQETKAKQAEEKEAIDTPMKKKKPKPKKKASKSSSKSTKE